MKNALAKAILLSHLVERAKFSISVDATNVAMGAVSQQHIKNNRQSLASFTKTFMGAQMKYSAYNRELLAIYEAVKYFRPSMEVRHFIIYTDHKPIIFTFKQNNEKCSPRQFKHLDFIVQFTNDIQHTPDTNKIRTICCK